MGLQENHGQLEKEEEKGGKAMTNKPGTFPLPVLITEATVHTASSLKFLFNSTTPSCSELIYKFFFFSQHLKFLPSPAIPIYKKKQTTTTEKSIAKKTTRPTSPHAVTY